MMKKCIMTSQVHYIERGTAIFDWLVILVVFSPESKVEGSAPKFTAKPSIKQVGAGVVFEVRLTADPEPDVTWFFGDSVIQDGSHYKISTQADGASYILLLEMATISATDGGSYKVTAKNKLGESNANINLNLGGCELATNPLFCFVYIASKHFKILTS